MWTFATWRHSLTAVRPLPQNNSLVPLSRLGVCLPHERRTQAVPSEDRPKRRQEIGRQSDTGRAFKTRPRCHGGVNTGRAFKTRQKSGDGAMELKNKKGETMTIHERIIALAILMFCLGTG